MLLISSKLLQFAKLQYQKGDFLAALGSFQESITAAREAQNLTDWIDSLRLQMQTLNELDRFAEAAPLFAEILHALPFIEDAKILGRAHVTLGFYLLQRNQAAEALSFLTTAAQHATRAQDFETLARALMFESFMNTLPDQSKWDQGLRCIEKVDLLAMSSGLEDIRVTCLHFKAYIAIQRRSFELGASYLWQAYKMAQNYGHPFLIPGLLLLLGQLHRDMGQQTQAQIFFDLSLKGLDPILHPRQYRRISEEAGISGSATSVQHDLIVQEASLCIQEKRRGFIDFKNQHVLLDMAFLMIKKQGQRFSKEDLAETIWKQAYNPAQHDNLIYVSIKRLRSLIEPDPENPRYILRDRRGYYFSSNCSISFENQLENHV